MNMKSGKPIITLLTDFGTEDGYVGAMKGVILSGVPDATIVDISHNIEPYNVRQAAYTLLNYAHLFPGDTIHLIVVDPGVGTGRKGLVVQMGDYFFIAPDNGVFSFITREHSFRAWEIDEKLFGIKISSTFHGRDIFAPAAVRIANGENPSDFGKKVSEIVSFYEPFQLLSPGECLLKILHVDHFGNLILNFSKGDLQKLGDPQNIKIRLKQGFLYGIKNTFGEAGKGQLLALWDSIGFLQISQNQGNAAAALNLGVGDQVILKYS